MRGSYVAVVFALGLMFCAGASLAAPIEVTSCGTVVQGNAILTGDLDCSAYPGDAVTLVGRSKLRLNGFTITASTEGDINELLAAVHCVPKKEAVYRPACRILGPGNIVGGTVGLLLDTMGARVRSVHVSGATRFGIAGGLMYVTDTIVQGNGVSSHEHGGIHGATLILRRSTVSDNGGFGTQFPQTRIFNSTLTGNGFAADCGPEPNECADIVSWDEPRVRAHSFCGTSTRINGVTFGICANDMP